MGWSYLFRCLVLNMQLISNYSESTPMIYGTTNLNGVKLIIQFSQLVSHYPSSQVVTTALSLHVSLEAALK